MQKNYIRKEPALDYLKWWRVIRRYTCIKHDISSPDLDIILYLYSEGLFNYWKYKEYSNSFGWDKGRFKRLKEKGWIHCWIKRGDDGYRLYEVTRQGRTMCTYMYKMLNYEMEIPESERRNPIMKKRTFSEKVLAISIKKFNEEVRKKNPQRRINY